MGFNGLLLGFFLLNAMYVLFLSSSAFRRVVTADLSVVLSFFFKYVFFFFFFFCRFNLILCLFLFFFFI